MAEEPLNPDEDRWIHEVKVAERTGVARSWLRRNVPADGIEIVGCLIRESAVERWIARRKIDPSDRIRYPSDRRLD